MQIPIGADTVKRGASPITLTSSLSSSKLKESNSSFSVKASNIMSEDVMESFLLERSKNSNGIGVKNVLFAAGVEKSPSSSYLSSDQLSGSLSHNSITPTTSTSQLIKQTLSPLVHHRPMQALSNSLADAKSAASPLKLKPNSVSSIGNVSSMGNYQLSSNTYIMTNNTGNGGKSSNFTLSSTSIDPSNAPIHQKPSSPSRSISSHTNTNTLPSHVGRSNNIQYQFESNYSIKNKPKNFTSPGNTTFFNALSSISASNAVTTASQTSTGVTNLASTSSIISNSSNIYGTLPKSANSLANSNAGVGIYGNVSAVANEFEQLIARNATGNNGIGSMSTTTSNSHGNYNTLGSYRVQYSSTNPFLNHFNSSDTNTSSDYKMTDDK